jgi:putative ABC transport system permease protein
VAIRFLILLALRWAVRRVLQSLLFVIGVAVGVAMLVGVDAANASAGRAFRLSVETVTGRTTHQIIGGPAGVPSELYRHLRTELGIRAAAPVIEGHVRAVDFGGEPLLLLGVDPLAEAPFRSYLVPAAKVQGENGPSGNSIFRLIVEPGTVVVSRSLAERYHLASGSTLRIGYRSVQAEVRVVGILEPRDATSREALDSVVLADIATAQELIGLPGRITRIDLIVPDATELARIQEGLPPGLTLVQPSANSEALGQMAETFQLNLQALSLLALVVGVFLIYNTVSFGVLQRRATLGILRAEGATRRQVFIIVLTEAMLLGLLGTVIGLLAGALLARSLVGLVAQTISDLYYRVQVQQVHITPLILGKGTAAGLVTSLLAAAVPAWEATHVPPVSAMRRSEIERRARRLIPWATTGAVALLGTGLALLALPTHSLLVSFAALFFLLLGSALLTPLALLLLMRSAVPITARMFGLVGRMAPRATMQALSRTAVAVAALAVAVSVTVGVSIMVASFRDTVEDWLDTTLGADVFITAADDAHETSLDLDPMLVGRVSAVEGVAHVASVRVAAVRAPDYPQLPPVHVAAITDDIARRPRRTAWNLAPGGDYWAALQAGQVMVTEAFAYRRGITPQHNTLTLLTDRGPQTFTVAAVYYDYATDQGTVLMSQAQYRRLFDDPYITSLAVSLVPGITTEEVISRLRTALADQDLEIQSNASLRTRVFEVFDRAFAVTVALRLLAMLVAFIGILSALLALHIGRMREYGGLRAVGMTPGQLWRLVLLQSGLMGGAAGVLALPMGLMLALVLIAIINVRSFGWTIYFTQPTGAVVQAVGLAVVAALLAGLYPAWRAARVAPGEALRNE